MATNTGLLAVRPARTAESTALRPLIGDRQHVQAERRTLERVGDDGQGDGDGHGPVCCQDRDDADDLAGRVRAHNAGRSG